MPDPAAGLSSLCGVARWCYGAAAVSVATVDDDGLRYVAAAGEGADGIVGTLLEPGRGIAGFVAATGQSLTVRDVTTDPRFARDVSERTGYVPTELQCIAVHDADGEVVAVMSLLDRDHDDAAPRGDASVPLTAFTDVAASLLASTDASDGPHEVVSRLDRLTERDRARALTAIGALLDAIER